LRLVLDTNTALSGLIWQCIPGAVLDAALARRIQLISSIPLLAELEGVLSRPKFQQVISQRGVNPADLFNGYVALVECVVPAALEVPVSRDPDDDQILAAAVSGDADLIVTGDEDLLVLGNYRQIPIVSARDALSRLEQSRP
jgi:uncharacterized protein